MQQIKVSLELPQIEFVNRYTDYGYKDKSALVRAAIQFLAEEFARAKLEESAELYSSLYDEDEELQELTDGALADWPE